jgi:hypothetical protein
VRRIASATAIAALLTAAPAQGFDAAHVDIIGLQLGMQEPEIIDRLTHQGYTFSRIKDAIAASTRDGRLQITLSDEHGVTEITYVFSGRGPGDPAKIRESVLIRFGDPDQAKPPTWCRAVRSDGICPPDQARLTFLPEVLTLSLRAEVTGQP